MNTHSIQQSWINLTSNCNNRCLFCYYGHNLSHDSKYLPTEMVGKIFNLLKNLHIEDCALIGGEPTLHPHLFEIISLGVSKGLKIGIVTNGRRLSNMKFSRELVSTGINRISISLEGSNQDIHDCITQRKGSFSQTVKAIGNLRNIGFNLDVITTISNSNFNNIQSVIDFLINMGFLQIVLNLCTPSISENFKNNEIVEMRALGEKISQVLKYRTDIVKINIVTPFPICLIPNISSNQRLGICQMFHGDGVTFDIDGSVLPCTHFSGAPLFNIFDGTEIISTDKFLERWNTFGRKFQNDLMHYPSNNCSGCKEWKKCFGGCPLFWTQYKPTDYISNEILI